MATGENNTTWGDVTNLNLGTALEEAIVGSADVTFASADVTLTLTDTNASQTARNMRLRCTGTTGGATRNLIVPSIEKPYIVRNDCADSVVVKTAAGTGITVPAGKTMWVYTDATNVVDAVTHLSSLTLSTPLPVSSGGTGVNTSLTAGSVVFAGASGAYSQDNANFFWDDTNNRLGIGTASPIGTLEVLQTSTAIPALQVTATSGTNPQITFTDPFGSAAIASGGGVMYLRTGGTSSSQNRVTVIASGNVGLGNGYNNPPERLSVDGNIRLSNTNSIFWGGTANYITGSNASNFLAFATNSAERMRIDASGNVGIGTSSPSDKLQVTGGILRVENTLGYGATMLNTSGMGMYMTLADQGNSSAVGTNNGSLIFYNSGNTTERMRIDSSGNVGIGTNSPGSMLDVAGSVQVTGAANARQIGFNFYGASKYNLYVDGSADADRMDIRRGTTNVATFNSAGNVGIGTTTPTAGYRLDVSGSANASGSFVSGGGTTSQAAIGNKTLSFYNTGSGDGLIKSDDDTSSFTSIALNKTQVKLFTSNTERMRIDSAGRVGIGTTTPGVYPYGAALNVEGSISMALDQRMGWGITDAFTLNGVTTAQYGFTYGGGTNLVTSSGYYGLNFSTLSAERMRITTGGNVLVGTNAASTGSKVQVRANYSAGEFFSAYCALPSGTSGGGGLTMGAIDIDNSQIASGSEYNSAGLHYAFGTTASNIAQISGTISFFTNAGLTAATTFTPTERMRITAAGGLAVGTTTDPGAGNIGLAAGKFLQFSSTAYMTPEDNVAGARIVTPGAFNLATGGTAVRMTVDSLGQVGIGTTAPGYRLDVAAGDTTANIGYAMRLRSNATATAAALQFTNNGATVENGIISCTDGGALTLNANGGASDIRFRVNGAERARITTVGDLLVGKTAVNATVVGAEMHANGTIVSSRAGSTNATSTLEVYSTGAAAYRFFVDMAGNINATSTSISAISDIRLKENVRDLDAGLDTILALKPRRFDWKEGKGKDVKDDMGFIAQEVETVLPELIGGWKAGEGEPDDLKSVKAGDLIPVLVKAIQELTARVAQLEGN
jgi:hypothetical protein